MPQTWAERFRHYLPFVAVPQLIVVLTVVVLCLATVILTGAKMATLPGAIGSVWLIAHGVPLRYDGVTLGVVPLAPIIAVVAVFSRRIRAATRSRVSVADLLAIAATTLLTTLTLSAITTFMASDSAKVFPLEPPPLALAFLAPLAVYLLGMVAGMTAELWHALARRYSVPERLVDAAGRAAFLVRRLVLASGVVYLLLLGLGAGRIGELLGAFPVLRAGGTVGLVLASIAYLPNAAVETLGVLLGGSFRLAYGSASLFAVDAVAVPPLPLFAALPGSSCAWAPLLFLVPAAMLIWGFAKRGGELIDAAYTAVFAALTTGILSVFAGGTAGAYGYVGVTPSLFAAAAFAWVGVVGVCAWAVAALRAPRADGGTESEGEPQTELEAENQAAPETEPDAPPEIEEPETEDAESASDEEDAAVTVDAEDSEDGEAVDAHEGDSGQAKGEDKEVPPTT